MEDICKGCMRWDTKEGICRGWLAPQGCNPLYSPSLYHKELTELIEHYERRASVGATSRLKQEIKPELYRLEQMMHEGIAEAYREDTSRGSGGGNSESDANAAASRKAKMKDNRYLGTKMTKEEREYMKNMYSGWEEETGEKLDTISPYSLLSKSKVDSYTGEVIKETKKTKKKRIRKVK